MIDKKRKDIADKLIALEIANRRKAIELYPAIIETVKKFDGKVLNKRLETALKKVNTNLRLAESEYRFDIRYWVENDSVSVPHRDYCGTEYVKYREIGMCGYIPRFEGKYAYSVDAQHPALNDDGRIIAEHIIVALNAGKENLESEIIQMEEHSRKADEYAAELEERAACIKNLQEKIPYLVAEYYGLGYSIRKN